MKIKTMDHIKYDAKLGEFVNYSDEDLATIRIWLKHPYAVVLKNVFDKGLLDDIRHKIFKFFQDTPETNPHVKNGSANFHRIDNNPEKSAVKRKLHSSISFYWNEDIAGETKLMRAMSLFKNEIAELPRTFTLNTVEKAFDSEWLTIPQITHYPLGGGRLNKHKDPTNIQYTTILAMMTEKGRDYQHGGFYVESAGEKILLDDYMEAGDVYMVSPEIVHGVDTIDEDGYIEVQWENPLGRWTLFPALVELKTLSGEKIEGLEDLDVDSYA